MEQPLTEVSTYFLNYIYSGDLRKKNWLCGLLFWKVNREVLPNVVPWCGDIIVG